MRKVFGMLLNLLLLSCSSSKPNQNQKEIEIDIVVYGGTSAGIASAIEARRMGKSVVLIEPTSRVGGLTTGGLGQTDIGNKRVVGGISKEFYQNIKKYYNQPENWKWQKREEYKDGGQTRTQANENSMWTFEPSVALKVYHDMPKEAGIQVEYNQRLDRAKGVRKKGGRIVSITMLSGRSYLGKMFIDATYEGDLMAAAGVSYTVGRESNSQYAETLNGVHTWDRDTTMTGERANNAINHNFVSNVDPYVVKGDKSSGLLPYINPNAPSPHGSGDSKVQAYCFRMCLTDRSENRIALTKPEGYNEQNYELLLRNYEAGETAVPWINSMMPNRKSDFNNRLGFSTDFIGQNYDYPEASYEERERIRERHRNYQKGLLWTLAYNPRIPLAVREVVSRWGPCKDEFERPDGWQDQLYVREARRMVGGLVMTQYHCEGLKLVEDPVGMAAYGMDSHHIQRYVTKDGFVKNEGNIEAHVAAPYPVGYRAIIPKRSECTNLFVPVCLSATHIAFGSIRMEPVFMVLGQSATVAASLAIDKGIAVQEVPYQDLRKVLSDKKQILADIIEAK